MKDCGPKCWENKFDDMRQMAPDWGQGVCGWVFMGIYKSLKLHTRIHVRFGGIFYVLVRFLMGYEAFIEIKLLLPAMSTCLFHG